MPRRPHFLQPLLRAPQSPHGLWSERLGAWVATRVLPAFDSTARRKGLLGRSGLAPGTAVVLAPCWAVHTAFMRFPIDVVFVDRQGRVRKVAPAVPAWRIRADPGAFAVLELAGGTLRDVRLQRGDSLELRIIVSPSENFSPAGFP